MHVSLILLFIKTNKEIREGQNHGKGRITCNKVSTQISCKMVENFISKHFKSHSKKKNFDRLHDSCCS